MPSKIDDTIDDFIIIPPDIVESTNNPIIVIPHPINKKDKPVKDKDVVKVKDEKVKDKVKPPKGNTEIIQKSTIDKHGTELSDIIKDSGLSEKEIKHVEDTTRKMILDLKHSINHAIGIVNEGHIQKAVGNHLAMEDLKRRMGVK